MVHWNRKLGQNFEMVMGTKAHNALAVLAVHFKIGRENVALKDVFDGIKKVKAEGAQSAVNRGIRLNDFLPKDKDRYYQYNGSLTTPGCDEVIVWIIFKDKVEISEEQMNLMREISYGDQGHIRLLSNNFRPLQGLNGRQILSVDATAGSSSRSKEMKNVVRAGWGSQGLLLNAGSDCKQHYFGVCALVLVHIICLYSFT